MKISQTFTFMRRTTSTLRCCYHCFGGDFFASMRGIFEIAFFVVFTNLFVLSLQAQTAKSFKREDFDLHYFRVKKIGIAIPGNVRRVANVHSVTVIDARADTSVAGLMQKKIIDPLSGLFNGAEKAQTE